MRTTSRYRTPIIVAATLVLVFSLLSLSLKRSPVAKKMEGVIITLSAPGLQGLNYVGHSMKRVWDGYFYLVGVERENVALKGRLEEYAQKEIRYQEALHALTRLEALLDLKRQVSLPVTGARIIAYDVSQWSRCAILDKGQSQGVKWGMPVLAAGGIVGRIMESYPGYSKVLLIVDRSSGADALVQRTRARGVLQGRGGNRCSLDYVPKSADIQVGDVVLASGLGGTYPQGLLFGKVTATDKKKGGAFQEIEVTPSVDLSTLEEVLVVQAATLALSP